MDWCKDWAIGKGNVSKYCSIAWLSPFFLFQYTVEIDDGKKKVDETVEIDTKKETEKFHVPSDGDNSPSAAGDVDVIYDFKRVSDRK